MSRFASKLSVFAATLMIAAQAFAGSAESSASSASEVVRTVPELDGGMAFLALGLTAAVIAVIKERRR